MTANLDVFNKYVSSLSNADESVIQIAKDKAEKLLGFMTSQCPLNRELSLAITKLEESIMWFEKGYINLRGKECT